MLMSEFRRRTGLTRDAVRLYVKLGLLRPATDHGNGYQHFDLDDIERAEMIRVGRLLGFSLKRMVTLAREHDAGALDAERRLAVMRQQLELVEAQAARIAAVREYVRAKIAWLEAGEPGAEPVFPGLDAVEGMPAAGVPCGCVPASPA
ncbi:MAG TPA: MerR family transcriptional regulator [Rhodanobacteraceae bacterium]